VWFNIPPVSFRTKNNARIKGLMRSKETSQHRHKSLKPPPAKTAGAAQMAAGVPDALTIQRAVSAPLSLSTRDVLQLQRAKGNRAVGSFLHGVLQRCPASRGGEAARASGQKTTLPARNPSGGNSQSEAAPPLQRRADGGAERSVEQLSHEGAQAGGIPSPVLGRMEHALGQDFSNVRLHRNSSKASEMGALAYTQGDEVHLAPGQFQPDTAPGQQLLGHELTHVAQQRQGRVRPTMQLKGVGINDDDSLEREADTIGMMAASANADNRSEARRDYAQPSSVGASPPVQRKLFINGKEVNPDAKIIKEIIDYYAGNLPFLSKTARNHVLYYTLNLKAYASRAAGLVKLLMEWAADDVEDDSRDFRTWADAMLAANMHLIAGESLKGQSEEERLKRKRNLEKLMGSTSSNENVEYRNESELDSDEEEEFEKTYPEFLDEASQSTDIFTDFLKQDEEERQIPLAVKRRKLQKSGKSELPGYKVKYRTYDGFISPKPNAFVLGELDQDYAPLLTKLVSAIGIETLKEEHQMTDRDVARLFLREFEGEDAFGPFAKETQRLAHKVITIIFFAELSRHSIALLSAAASFFAVANRDKDSDNPGLVEIFDTSQKETMRPIFAGTGGPDLMRGAPRSKIKEMSEKDVSTRRVRAVLDIQNFFQGTKSKGEDIQTFIKRRTLEFIFNLSKQADEKTVSAAFMSSVLYRFLKQVKAAKKVGDDPLVTLGHLGFTHHPQPGDENECALNTIYHQLTHRYGVDLGDIAAFRKHVREHAGFAFGAMIDILNNGQAMLAAVNDYIVNVLHLPALHLIIDVWAATADGNLMDFEDVAQHGGGGVRRVLTFYYNGVNHFDSLSGGLSRN
jgi:hypothetical protein